MPNKYKINIEDQKRFYTISAEWFLEEIIAKSLTIEKQQKKIQILPSDSVFFFKRDVPGLKSNFKKNPISNTVFFRFLLIQIPDNICRSSI